MTDGNRDERQPGGVTDGALLPSAHDVVRDMTTLSGPTTVGARLKTYFFTGLIVAGPLAITAYIIWWLVTLVDGWVKPLIPLSYLPETYLPFAIPGFGLIVAFVGLTLLGFLTAGLVGRTLLNFGERILARMPVVRGLYKGVKQVFETIFSQSGSSFRKVGLVQFPAPGMWSIVFLSAPPSEEMASHMPEAGDYVSAFMPCTPNPTTGFFFFVPRKDLIEVSISVEDAAKLIMSAGMIQPVANAQAKLAQLAETARLTADPVPSTRIAEKVE
ncbi:putative membrane protein [Hyphomicrobiales bacterium]|nr:putative membrane protein [Hyphomicrobiales bacterium]CAH1675176.1 putative membrane protein [Hyphomicrobiales bacterium]